MTRYRLGRGVKVTWNGDEIHIDSGLGAEREITVRHEAILSIMHGFGTPRTREEAVESFADEDSADDVRAAIDGLIEVGILVPADTTRTDPLVAHDFARIIPVEEHRRRIRERIQKIPGLVLEDGGMTVTNCGKDRISPGCRSCKEGRWLCVFPSFLCNADCSFCPQTHTHKQNAAIPLAELDKGLLPAIEQRAEALTGLSVSGGELFLNLEAAKKILEFVTRRFPHIYTWGYTNGITATVAEMKALAAAGMQEIRFDLAATDFSRKMLDKVEIAAREIFPWVSVEVPAYEGTRRALIDDGKLLELERIGVKALNLAEVTIIEADSPVFAAFRHEEVYRPDVLTGFCVARSREITLDILEHAREVGCRMPINDCSTDTKILQSLSKSIVLGDADEAK